MSGFFRNMGFIQWPMYIATFFMLVQIVRAALQTRRPVEARDPMIRHTVLVWGFLNALLGVLGTVLGLALAGESISRAAAISPPIIAGGIKIALSTTIFGLFLLVVAVVAWLILQVSHTRASGGAGAGLSGA